MFSITSSGITESSTNEVDFRNIGYLYLLWSCRKIQREFWKIRSSAKNAFKMLFVGYWSLYLLDILIVFNKKSLKIPNVSEWWIVMGGWAGTRIDSLISDRVFLRKCKDKLYTSMIKREILRKFYELNCRL